MPWGWKIITPYAMLAVRLGQPLLKHSVIISYYCRELGVQVKKRIWHPLDKGVENLEKCYNLPCLLMVSP